MFHEQQQKISMRSKSSRMNTCSAREYTLHSFSRTGDSGSLATRVTWTRMLRGKLGQPITRGSHHHHWQGSPFWGFLWRFCQICLELDKPVLTSLDSALNSLNLYNQTFQLRFHRLIFTSLTEEYGSAGNGPDSYFGIPWFECRPVRKLSWLRLHSVPWGRCRDSGSNQVRTDPDWGFTLFVEARVETMAQTKSGLILTEASLRSLRHVSRQWLKPSQDWSWLRLHSVPWGTCRDSGSNQVRTPDWSFTLFLEARVETVAQTKSGLIWGFTLFLEARVETVAQTKSELILTEASLFSLRHVSRQWQNKSGLILTEASFRSLRHVSKQWLKPSQDLVFHARSSSLFFLSSSAM
jgi:hypothetical protein